MNVNGLWTAEFTVGSTTGNGVVVFLNGRLLGGDDQYYYAGSYTESAGQLRGELLLKHYAGPQISLFGPIREMRLTLEGAVGGDLIMAQGYDASTTIPRRVSVRLRRVQII